MPRTYNVAVMTKFSLPELTVSDGEDVESVIRQDLGDWFNGALVHGRVKLLDFDIEEIDRVNDPQSGADKAMAENFEITTYQIDNLSAICFKLDSLSRIMELDRLGSDEEDIVAAWSENALGNVVSNISRIIQELTKDLYNILDEVEHNQNRAPESTLSQVADSGA